MKLALKFLTGAFAVVGVITVSARLATPAFAQERDEEKSEKPHARTAPSANVSPVKAMRLAEKATGGTAAIATFEFEDGHWIYGVVVAKGGKLMEVELNAMTGKVGDTEAITPDGEAKEFSAELKSFAKRSH